MIHKSINVLREQIFAPNRSPFELEQSAKIESLRERLTRQPHVFEMQDFGAGAPNDTRTWEQMKRGVRVQRDIRDLVLNSCRNVESGLWLMRIVGYLRPNFCVELGTCVGLSAAFIGSALDVNGSGVLHTIEADPTLKGMAETNVGAIGVHSVLFHLGTFEAVLPSVLANSLVEFGFVDGHHTGRAMIRNTELILSRAAGTALVVLDDIMYSTSTEDAWRTLCKIPEVKGSFVMGALGVLAFGAWAD